MEFTDHRCLPMPRKYTGLMFQWQKVLGILLYCPKSDGTRLKQGFWLMYHYYLPYLPYLGDVLLEDKYEIGVGFC